MYKNAVIAYPRWSIFITYVTSYPSKNYSHTHAQRGKDLLIDRKKSDYRNPIISRLVSDTLKDKAKTHKEYFERLNTA